MPMSIARATRANTKTLPTAMYAIIAPRRFLRGSLNRMTLLLWKTGCSIGFTDHAALGPDRELLEEDQSRCDRHIVDRDIDTDILPELGPCRRADVIAVLVGQINVATVTRHLLVQPAHQALHVGLRIGDQCRVRDV